MLSKGDRQRDELMICTVGGGVASLFPDAPINTCHHITVT